MFPGASSSGVSKEAEVFEMSPPSNSFKQKEVCISFYYFVFFINYYFFAFSKLVVAM